MMRRAGTSELEGGFKAVSFREMDHERDSLIVVQFKARKHETALCVACHWIGTLEETAEAGLCPKCSHSTECREAVELHAVELHVEETRGCTGTKRARAKNIRFTYSAEAWAELKRLINEVGA